MAGIVSPNMVEDGLILYWDPLNPISYVSGSLSIYNVVDQTTYVGSIPATASYDPNTKLFKTNTGLISSTISFLQGAQDATISIWMNQTSTTAFSLYFGTELGGVSTDKFYLRGSNNASNAFQILMGYLNTGSVATAFFNGANATPLTPTCNLTYTWDSGGNVGQYRNGKLISQSSIGANFLQWNFQWSNLKNYLEYSSNMVIYNRALSASEILQNYNAMKDRF